jgi:hypothetical protein
VPFSYYDRLTAAEKRTYRKSAGVTEVALPPGSGWQKSTRKLEQALISEKRATVQRAATALCNRLFDALAVPRVVVKVLSRRPRDHEGELHGLYTWEDGKSAQIEVWMRTAEQRRVVAFRTFLRTLLHEVCHHLDYTYLGLDDTFHTEGFFRRESSLFRQLVPAAKPRTEARPPREPAAPADKARQLRLFG